MCSNTHTCTQKPMVGSIRLAQNSHKLTWTRTPRVALRCDLRWWCRYGLHNDDVLPFATAPANCSAPLARQQSHYPRECTRTSNTIILRLFCHSKLSGFIANETSATTTERCATTRPPHRPDVSLLPCGCGRIAISLTTLCNCGIISNCMICVQQSSRFEATHTIRLSCQ